MDSKTKEELLKEVKDDIEAFGEKRIVYPYFLNGKLLDYSLYKDSDIQDFEELGILLSILEDME